ncbi:hypothetical protein B0T22DRAFT_243567 [Podospora appendiculata]|uniref:Uncharacterized protein n=1 Tax=Podospora appendiculata TaxID=314037 RepID=A0AAE0WZZ2_9PEZI|nr:hypothetical protein B0T22DRAFT_302464 [Podospora appendiculata]KAK3686257.1 hypothetical protein B0T22DRAFT_243567 [Podospora appendiculata]
MFLEMRARFLSLMAASAQVLDLFNVAVGVDKCFGVMEQWSNFYADLLRGVLDDKTRIEKNKTLNDIMEEVADFREVAIEMHRRAGRELRTGTPRTTGKPKSSKEKPQDTTKGDDPDSDPGSGSDSDVKEIIRDDGFSSNQRKKDAGTKKDKGKGRAAPDDPSSDGSSSESSEPDSDSEDDERSRRRRSKSAKSAISAKSGKSSKSHHLIANTRRCQNKRSIAMVGGEKGCYLELWKRGRG